jgi:hypothetical protein
MTPKEFLSLEPGTHVVLVIPGGFIKARTVSMCGFRTAWSLEALWDGKAYEVDIKDCATLHRLEGATSKPARHVFVRRCDEVAVGC